MAQRKLGKATDHRMAMLKTLTSQVILNEQITTTEARAKELKSIVESLISLAIKESKNYEMAKVKVSKVKVDKDGNKVTEKAGVLKFSVRCIKREGENSPINYSFNTTK